MTLVTTDNGRRKKNSKASDLVVSMNCNEVSRRMHQHKYSGYAWTTRTCRGKKTKRMLRLQALFFRWLIQQNWPIKFSTFQLTLPVPLANPFSSDLKPMSNWAAFGWVSMTYQFNTEEIHAVKRVIGFTQTQWPWRFCRSPQTCNKQVINTVPFANTSLPACTYHLGTFEVFQVCNHWGPIKNWNRNSFVNHDHNKFP